MQRFVSLISAYDSRLFHFFHLQLQCKLFDWLMPKVTHLGGATATLSFSILFVLLPLPYYKAIGIQLLASLIISHIIVHILKKSFHRQRPFQQISNTRLFENKLKDFSFPSGHTTAIFSIVIVLCYHFSLLSIILLPLGFVIGLSRMYLGFHYPTDCLVGFSIGTFTSLLFLQFSLPFNLFIR